jgi:hypothetical protein
MGFGYLIGFLDLLRCHVPLRCHVRRIGFSCVGVGLLDGILGIAGGL